MTSATQSQSATSRARANVRVNRLASHPNWSFADHLELERQTVEAIASGQSPGRLLLSEVTPVLTQGRGSTSSDLWATENELNSRGISLLPVSRGGKTTYHGPGQWILFPVAPLESLVGDSRGVRKMVCALLKIAQETAAAFGVESEIREGAEAGLWTAAHSSGGKLASLGIQIEKGIVRHGLSLNVFSTPTSFYGIHPCGLVDAKADFLFKDEPTGNREFMQVGERLIDACLRQFPVFLGDSGSVSPQLDCTASQSYTVCSVSSHVGS